MHFILLTIPLLCLLLGVHGDAGIIATPNFFEANLAKRLDPESESLKQLLWGGTRNLSLVERKRESLIIDYKLRPNLEKRAKQALISLPTCLRCAKKKGSSSEIAYDDFTAAKLVNLIIPGGRDGNCLFYGQREKNIKPAGLSGSASDLACDWPKKNDAKDKKARAIWHMWPQDKTRNRDYGLNYYCLNAWNPVPCWLNKLMPAPDITTRETQTRPYFQQMSAAMALTCTGQIYLLHDRPDNVNYQPLNQPTSIWISHELPVLKRLYRQGVVSGLTVIPTTDGPFGKGTPQRDTSKWVDRTSILKEPVKRDIEWTPEMVHFLKNREQWARAQEFAPQNATEEEDHLEARWKICSGSAADQEDPNLDYFG